MYIGIDLGGTNISIGLVNESGKLIYRKSCYTRSDRHYENIINDMIDLTKEMIKDKDLITSDIKGIGIGIPGITYIETGNIECVNLGWYDIPLKAIVEEKINIPVFIDNDASVAALAEYEVGSMRNTKNSVLLTLGTGVGGGIILNSRLYNGSNGIASEIGHMVVGENFYDCNCGKNGCLETFSSATAIIKYTKKLIEESETNTLILEKVNGNLDLLNARIIFDSCKYGDEIAIKAVKRFVKYLGIGIINIINIIDPEVISLGGGVSLAGEYLLKLVKDEVEKNKLFKKSQIGRITLAETGNEAGIIGAAMLCKY